MAPSTLLEKLKLIKGYKVLIFMPHPDDESVFLSGTIRQLVSHGIKVKVITATRGEASTLRFGLKDRDDLAAVREKELKRVFRLLGIREYEILHFPDGKLGQPAGQAKILRSEIKREITTYLPHIIITLEPDGIYGHPDHINLSAMVKKAVRFPCRLVYVTIADYSVKPQASRMAAKPVNPLKPNLVVKLGVLDKLVKIRCLRAHQSQFNFQKSEPKNNNFFKANRLLEFEYLVI